MSTAETLIVFEKYLDSNGEMRPTRIATISMEWLITAVDGKIYHIDFDKNFAKKHLYTSSKKKMVVKEEVITLWNALSKMEKDDYWWKGYWVSYPPELWIRAQKNVDQRKFKKQVAHRSTDEQKCDNCGHSYRSHYTHARGGNCGAHGCGCVNFVAVYEKKRTDQGKPTVNPLSGATTNTNTVFMMNKIPKATLEQTITNAIIAKETAVSNNGKVWGEGQTGRDVDCEKVTIDFGHAMNGCILEITAAGDFSTWAEKRSVPVSIKKLPQISASQPVYSIGHMFGLEAI